VQLSHDIRVNMRCENAGGGGGARAPRAPRGGAGCARRLTKSTVRFHQLRAHPRHRCQQSGPIGATQNWGPTTKISGSGWRIGPHCRRGQHGDTGPDGSVPPPPYRIRRHDVRVDADAVAVDAIVVAPATMAPLLPGVRLLRADRHRAPVRAVPVHPALLSGR